MRDKKRIFAISDSRQSASSRNSQRPDSFTGSNDPNRLSGISARSDDKYNSLPRK